MTGGNQRRRGLHPTHWSGSIIMVGTGRLVVVTLKGKSRTIVQCLVVTYQGGYPPWRATPPGRFPQQIVGEGAPKGPTHSRIQWQIVASLSWLFW